MDYEKERLKGKLRAERESHRMTVVFFIYMAGIIVLFVLLGEIQSFTFWISSLGLAWLAFFLAKRLLPDIDED